MNSNDIKYAPDMPTAFLPSKHVTYIAEYDTKCQNEYEMTEYLRLSGIYWSLTALDLLKARDRLDEGSIVELVKSCQGENGGFSPAPRHDASILYTLSAVQIMCIYDRFVVDIFVLSKVEKMFRCFKLVKVLISNPQRYSFVINFRQYYQVFGFNKVTF